MLTKDGIVGVHGDLVLGGVTNETLCVGEGDITRRGTVTLVVGDDFDLAVLEDADARVRRAQVNTYCGCLGCHGLTMCISFCKKMEKTGNSVSRALDMCTYRMAIKPPHDRLVRALCVVLIFALPREYAAESRGGLSVGI